MQVIDDLIDKAFLNIEAAAKSPSLTVEELGYLLSKFLDEMNCLRTVYEFNFKGVYRARKQKFVSVEDAYIEFGHADKLKYPPVEFATASRCNEEFDPVFYCSINPKIPIYEVRPEKDDYIVLASFEPKDKEYLQLTLPIIGVKELKESLSLKYPSEPLIKILDKDLHYRPSGINNDTISKAIDIKMAKWFTESVTEENKYIYRLTTAFYYVMMRCASHTDPNENIEEIKSLIYPSVESEISGFNLVIKPSVYDSELKLSHVIIYKVEDKMRKTLKLRRYKESGLIDESGTIHWIKTNKTDSLLFLNPAPRFFTL